MRFPVLATFVTCLVLTSVADAQSRKLEVGDSAPGLDIDKWVKGEETVIERDRVFVVEFWATWCGPCRKSIPHLTELQQHYGDGVTIIGVSDEKPDVVERFVRSQGDKMDYTVAVDRRKITGRAWMRAAGVKGIPSAFIVDQQGKIAFIGHPLSEEFEDTLASVLTGRYDPKLQEQAEPLIAAARSARKVRNWRLATKHYEQVITLNPRVFAEIALEQFEMVLVDMNERDTAYVMARDVMAARLFNEDPEAMAMLARKIASDPAIPTEQRDMDAALEFAQASLQGSGPHNPGALSTVALVHYRRQELDEAIRYQEQAYFRANRRDKDEYKRVLRTYQQAATRAAALSSR